MKMPTLTTEYSLNKPLVNNATDSDLWGGQLNDNLDTIDEELKAVSDKADANETDIDSLTTTVNANLTPAGSVSAYAGETIPSGWVECNGQSLNRTTYATLFAAIGTLYGSADGATFKVPDLRGYFIRGKDGGRGVDPDSSRAVGSTQQDAFQGHEHQMRPNPSYATPTVPNCFWEVGGPNTPYTTGAIVEKSGYGAPRYAAETRPKNIAMKYIIKT